MATTAMDYENAPGGYEDEAPRYAERNRSRSPMRDSGDGERRRSPSPVERTKDASLRPDEEDDGAVNPGSNLFVTGIHPNLSEGEVTRLFEKYGNVEKCQIMRDPHSKESRGFGFVKMVTSDEADAAKEGLQGENIEGRTLSIEKARRAKPRTPTPGKYFGPPKRDNRPGRFDDRRRGGGGGYGGDGYGSGYGRDRGEPREYRSYRGYGSRYDDRDGGDRDYPRDSRGGNDRYREDRGYDRRERGGDDYYSRDRYGSSGGGRYERGPRGGGSYDRERYDRPSERSRDGPAGGYGDASARSDAREGYGGSERAPR